MSVKERVREYWNAQPCGTGNIQFDKGTVQYYKEIALQRYKKEPFIYKYAEFRKFKDKKVLEIGCGVGTDLINFADSGADAFAIDLSYQSVVEAKKHLECFGVHANIHVCDSEHLCFLDNTFDHVYSWGSIHHTENPQNAVDEVYRVLKPGGTFCVMLYHKYSLVGLQMYLRYGLFQRKSLDDVFANHHESPCTRAYSLSTIRKMFAQFNNVQVTPQITCYDLRYTRDKFLPLWVGNFVPSLLGFFVIIKGTK